MATSLFRLSFATLDGEIHDSKRHQATDEELAEVIANTKVGLRATDGVFSVEQANGDLVMIPHHAIAHVTLIKG